MRVALIGAGNLATNLGKALIRAEHEVVQVWSRTEESAGALAMVLKCSWTTNLEEVVKNADVFIIAVKDSVLALVASALKEGREGQLMVHTAGSLPMGVLPTERRGVLYPMQTFSKNKEVDFRVIPCFVESSKEKDLALLKTLSSTISNTVYELDGENRKYLHLAAVFCCNFANHCFTLSADLLKKHGDLPFSVMLPLIDETAAKLYAMSPREAQTGPAVRWDENVMANQLQLLADESNMQKIYELMSKSIHGMI